MIGARVFMTKANNNVTDSDPRFPGNVTGGNVFLAAEHLANAA